MTEIITEKQRKNRAYYEANREKVKARVAQYRLDNKEKIAKWKKDNEVKLKEYSKKYLKQYVQSHKEQHNARGRKWREANPEKNAARCRKWKQANHDKVMESWRKRRAIQLSIEGDHFTDAQFQELCDFYGNVCLDCGKADIKLTADHVTPLSLQVSHSDEITNIQPLCLSCNSKKGTKTVDYRKLLLEQRGVLPPC